MKKSLIALTMATAFSGSVMAASVNDPSADVNQPWTIAQAEQNGYEVSSQNNTAYLNGKPVSAEFLIAMMLQKTAESERYEKYPVTLRGERIDKQDVIQPGMTYQWFIEGTTGGTMERIAFEDNIPFHTIANIYYVEIDDNGREKSGTQTPVSFDADSKGNVKANIIVRPNTRFRIKVVSYYLTNEELAQREGFELPVAGQ